MCLLKPLQMTLIKATRLLHYRFSYSCKNIMMEAQGLQNTVSTNVYKVLSYESYRQFFGTKVTIVHKNDHCGKRFKMS